jgi:hypothetical protein
MNTDQKDFPWAIVFFFIILKLLIHFLTNTNYEIHRDAFLYIAQGDHPAWGYISVPPLTAMLSKVFRMLFGESVFALRLLPALFGGLSVLYISLIVRNLGGRTWALVIANTSFLFSIAYLRTNTLLQPVAIDLFFWLAAFYYILRLLKTQDIRYWIHLAIVFGIGFMNKYSIVFLALGFFISLLLTNDRKLIWNRFFLYACILGLILILPNLIWQYSHNWPVIFHMEMLNRYQLVNVRLTDFILAQLLMNLNALFTWILGLVFLLFHKSLKSYRVIGLTWITVMFILILAHGKHYYTLGLYTMLFAVGGYVFERYVRPKFLIYANLAYTILISLPLLPVGLPILKHDRMLSYSESLVEIGLDMPMRWEDGRVHPLPQDFADMIGWKELADIVIRTYHNLSPEQKKQCYIYAENYGEAGSIYFYGKKAGLPDPVCFNGSFLFWAPPEVDDLKCLIYVNDEIEGLLPFFEEIHKAGEITNPYARETGLPVWFCKRPKADFYSFYKQRIQEEKEPFTRKK